jgi:hypothetical protein
MSFWAYWAEVARRAFAASWSLIGFERPARVAIVALIAIVWAVLVWSWLGADSATASIVETAAGILAPLIVLPAIYIWKFVETPWLMAREGAAMIADFQAATSNDGATARDMTIGDLFRHIRSDVLEEQDERRWLAVGTEVTQAFADGRLQVWGRRCATEQGWQAQDWEPLPIHQIIAPDRWRWAGFTYQFFDAGSANNAHVRWRMPRSHTEFFFDVRVNRAEALRIWPRP